MTYSKTFVRFFSVLLAAVLAWGGLASNVYADADSISINFSSDRNGNQASPTGGNLGAFPVNYQYWNNVSGASGTNVPLISNTGAATGVSGTWSSNNTWDFDATKPSTDNNAILYYGYLDDGGNHASFDLTAPYFNYDIYYYPSTDSERFRFVTINSINYYGNGGSTVLGTNNWGTPVKSNINASEMVEGVNYLRVSSSDSTIKIQGQNNVDIDGGRARGSFGAVQIVNTANSQSTTTDSNYLVLENVTWNNDLTGYNEYFNASADGHRIIYTGSEDSFTVDLNGATTNLPNIKLIGSATNLTFTNGVISQLGKTNTLTDLTKMGTTVNIPNFAQVAPQGAVKLGSNVYFNEATADKNVISGAYYVDNGTTSFASVIGGSIQATETTTTLDNNVNLLVNTVGGITDNSDRDLNSLTTETDYISQYALSVTSGMVIMQGNSHWIKGGGTITSGYESSENSNDLYVGVLGTAVNMQINNNRIVDPGKGRILNFIKTGDGALSLANATSTYTGKTSVLEGKLYICENISSTDFYVAHNAQLNFSSKNYNNEYLGDFSFEATSLSGYGTLEIGNNNNTISLTLQNVVNDGSKFSRVNAYGNDLTLNNSELHATLIDNTGNMTLNDYSTIRATHVNNRGVITLNNSTIEADSFASVSDSTVIFDATSTLNAPIATVAGSLTLDIPYGRDLEITTSITGKGGIIKDGGGTLVLSTNNTYAAATFVNEGTLRLTIDAGTGALPPGQAVTVDGENSVLTGKGDILGWTGGAIGRLTLQNGGTLNSEAGGHTTVNNVVYMNKGFITAGDNGADWNYIFDNAIHVTGETNNQITADLICFRDLSGTSLADGDSAGLIDVAGEAKLTITSAIGNYGTGEGVGPSNITKAGDGELVLTGTSVFNKDLTVNGGILDLTEGKLYDGAYAGNANVYVNDGGTLKVNNFGYSANGRGSLGGLTYHNNGSTNIHFNGGTIQVTESYGSPIDRSIELLENGGTLDILDNVTLTLSANEEGVGSTSGVGRLTKAGLGTLELTSVNTYEGGTTISQGAVTLSGAGTLGAGDVAIADNAVLNFNHDDEFTFNNSVSGSGTINKTGAGNLKIRNDNPGSFAAKSFLVQTGELDFLGHYKGVLEIGSGATLSPGNSIGTLTIDGTEVDPQMGAFTLDSGSTLLMEVGYDDNNVFTSDQLVVNGNIVIDPNSTILLSLIDGTVLPSEFTLDLVSGTGATEETLAAFSRVLSAPDFQDYTLLLNGGVIQLISGADSNAVPEPSTWALLALGVIALFLRKRVRS